MPWCNCIFTNTGVVFPPCLPPTTQPSRPSGSGSSLHLNQPSRDIPASLEQIELINRTASAATTPTTAPDPPAASSLPWGVEDGPLASMLARSSDFPWKVMGRRWKTAKFVQAHNELAARRGALLATINPPPRTQCSILALQEYFRTES